MHSKFPVAVHIFFLRTSQILLLHRFNTGYEDGKYSLVAGHLEAGETVTQGAIREAREEVGVFLDPQDLQFVHVMNRRSEDEWIYFFVVARRWAGEITNTEPHKCDHLAWFPLESLPQNTMPYVKFAIEKYQEGSYYSEFGWG
jgi:8-oxo-dGTP diphosphatase